MKKESTTARFNRLHMFEKHLLHNLIGQVGYKKERYRKISKAMYIVDQ
jgi:hypothetical protein